MSDLISRAAVIEAVHDEFDGCLVWDESGKATANEVERIIASLPSAQPERMRGKWIDDGDPFMWVCDVCGYRVKRYNNTRYCPHCGAKMEVDDGSD